MIYPLQLIIINESSLLKIMVNVDALLKYSYQFLLSPLIPYQNKLNTATIFEPRLN